MLFALILGAISLALAPSASAQGALVDPYTVAAYSHSALAGEQAAQAAIDAREDHAITSDALFLISGLDYQRFIVGDKNVVYIVLRDRKLDTSYHPLCEHNVDKFTKVGLVKARNSLEPLSPTQAATLRELAAKCRSGALNPRFTVTGFEHELDEESGADNRLHLRDTVTTVARTILGTYGLLRGYGRVPSYENSHSITQAN